MLFINAFDLHTEGLEFLLDLFVTSVEMFPPGDNGLPVSDQASQNE
jgi:hypothetical protein